MVNRLNQEPALRVAAARKPSRTRAPLTPERRQLAVVLLGFGLIGMTLGLLGIAVGVDAMNTPAQQVVTTP